jgi:hypothetical protein
MFQSFMSAWSPQLASIHVLTCGVIKYGDLIKPCNDREQADVTRHASVLPLPDYR